MVNNNIALLKTKLSFLSASIEKVDVINNLAFEIRNTDTQRAILLSKEAKEISTILNYLNGIATALSNEGFCYVQITNYELALEKLFEALKIFEVQKNELGIAQVNYNLSLVYFRLSDFNNGIDSTTKALSYYQKNNDKNEMARCYFQMGFLYNSLNDCTSGIEYFKLGIDLSRETNNKASEVSSIMGLGQVYLNLKEYDKSRTYLLESMAIRKQINDWRGYAAAMNAYMILCIETQQFEEAKEISIKGIKLCTKLGDKMGISRFMLDLGKIYFHQNNIIEAEKIINEALAIAEKINLKLVLVPAYLALYDIYLSKGDFENALKNYKQFHNINEEISNRNAVLKAKTILYLSKIENAHQELEINRLKNIELKNAFDEIKNKNKEITDSINYAKKIQAAILPAPNLVKQYLENTFILYKPKDIVSGDFYWMEVVNDLVLFAACDATGHGVPGAMVSLVCHNALNRAVKEFCLTQPAAILNKTAEIVIGNFKNDQEDIKDGMDISLCTYNFKTKKLQWAGANNPLWFLQNGELVETKADKQSIGINMYTKPFTNHTFTLNNGDTIYLFTDGFADQFSGDKQQKKLTKKGFKDLILTFQNKSLEEQGIELDKFITEYKKGLEQIDDILVMCIKV